jgi:hypothetical protein
MTTPNPITPPPKLVASLRNSAPHGIRDAGDTREHWLINRAYAAGADQELEACCEWTAIVGGADALRAARRPKAPSLKEQALEVLKSRDLMQPLLDGRRILQPDELDTILRAVEALPND